MKKRRSWSEQQRKDIVAEYIATGRPKKSWFCDQKQIAESQLYAWLNLYEKHIVTEQAAAVAAPDPELIIAEATSTNRTPIPLSVKQAAVARLQAKEDISVVARDNNRKPSTIRSWVAEVRRAEEHDGEFSPSPSHERASRIPRGGGAQQIKRMDATIFINHAALELDKSGIRPSQLPTRDLLWLLSRRRALGEP